MLLCCASLGLGTWAVGTQAGFFDEHERAEAEQEWARESAKQGYVQELLNAPCNSAAKRRSVALVLYEDTPGGRRKVADPGFSPLFSEIVGHLNALGIKTYSQEQIRARIAQAELEAVASGDIDAAISASRRLGAGYVLRGQIAARAGTNRVVGIEEVFVNVSLSLSNSAGKLLVTTGARGDSWAGQDVVGAALEIVRRDSDRLAAEINNAICQSK